MSASLTLFLCSEMHCHRVRCLCSSLLRSEHLLGATCKGRCQSEGHVELVTVSYELKYTQPPATRSCQLFEDYLQVAKTIVRLCRCSHDLRVGLSDYYSMAEFSSV
eukprot:2596375-Amphidinium_carterae.2